ncbi:hypothetical protein ACFW9F_01320 [Streptomyces sp. NPDC059506]|uniref:hypothetical protein n=1 Tax=Streptomyces sp. NPDC059506 TaxID=3347751 RepID=UPI0036B91681
MNPTLDQGSTPAPGRHHQRLVSHLIDLKKRSGRSFAQLAANSRIVGGADGIGAVSATTLKRAVDLKRVPGERVVTAYVRACGVGGDQEALQLWRAARAEDRGLLGLLRAPEVDSIRTRADLAAALAAAYERAGAPILRVLQERAATAEASGPVLLPRTSAWRIARRGGRPATWKQCEAYLRGCGIPARHMTRWKEAWERTATGRTAGRQRFEKRHAPGALARRGRTPSSALVNWTPQMEQSAMATMKALAALVEDVKPMMENMDRPVMVLGKAMGPAHDAMKPQLERSAMAAVDALATLLRSSDPMVRHAALTQGLARAVEAIARLNGIGPSSSPGGQLDPM